MSDYAKLYGRSIIPGLHLNRIEQVCNVLREEIQSGRWRIEDRMPSVSELVRKTGLSRGSVQQVFNQLEKEGYVCCHERKGTFLSSIMPPNLNPTAKIGVAMIKEEPGAQNPPFLFQLYWIHEAARKQQLGLQVIYFDNDCDRDKINLVNGAFDRDVKGILTPYPFHRPLFSNLSSDRIPVVFVGPHLEDSLPFVCGDTWFGAYHLTKKVIEAGHKKIIACCRPGELAIETEQFLKGYRAAMQEYGIEVNEAAIKDSFSVPLGSLRKLKEYVLRYDDATAIVSSLYIRSQNLVSVCDLIGKKVPDDLSIVSRDSSVMRLDNPKETFTCFEYDTPKAVAVALDILRELIESGTCKYSRVMIPPILKDGQSLRTLK